MHLLTDFLQKLNYCKIIKRITHDKSSGKFALKIRKENKINRNNHYLCVDFYYFVLILYILIS